MKAVRINEGKKTNPKFKLPADYLALKKEYPLVFSTLSWAHISGALQNAPDTTYTSGKIDPDKIYKWIKQYTPYNKDFKTFKNLLIEAMPILGLSKLFKFNKDERSAVSFQERFIYGDQADRPLDYYVDAEVPRDQAEETDKVVRDDYGKFEEAYYRFDHKLTPHDSNMLRAAYALTYGDGKPSPWKNYLDARPIYVYNARKPGKSFTQTRDLGDFGGETYD